MRIVTISGIRPDFIRMSKIYSELDSNPNIDHILVHTGQHFDKLLSGVFFDDLGIRKPDYNLEVGAHGKEHFHDQRLTLIHSNYSEITRLASKYNISGLVNGVLVDCGVSSPQLDNAKRGFSFKYDAWLVFVFIIIWICSRIL